MLLTVKKAYKYPHPQGIMVKLEVVEGDAHKTMGITHK